MCLVIKTNALGIDDDVGKRNKKNWLYAFVFVTTIELVTVTKCFSV